PILFRPRARRTGARRMCHPRPAIVFILCSPEHRMQFMSRLKIALVVLGGMLSFFGIQEWRVSRGTTPEPIAVTLADVEAGKAPANCHWNIGEHVAIYNAGVYSYKQSKYAT